MFKMEPNIEAFKNNSYEIIERERDQMRETFCGCIKIWHNCFKHTVSFARPSYSRGLLHRRFINIEIY